MFDVHAVQESISRFGFDGWLFSEFRGGNLLARRILRMSDREMGSRRVFYFVPSSGEPVKLVHKIESGALDHLPGEKRIYLRWQTLERELGRILEGGGRIAMEYSPRNAIPYIARVDAGTVELVRSFNVEVCSSGDLVQQFEAVWSEDQWQLHLEAEKINLEAFELAFGLISERASAGKPATETEVQAAIVRHFLVNDLLTDHPPIVAGGPHSGNPHFAPEPSTDRELGVGEFVLIDLWSKRNRPGAVFSDITKNAYVGSRIPTGIAKVFKIVAEARDAGIALVRDGVKKGCELRGCDVDDAVRSVIKKAGYGEQFIHRTGHSIGEETHGNGANIDNLETRDERLLLPRTCFSIEPGIYLEEFGIRCEVDVFLGADGTVHVTGGVQTEVEPLL